MLRLSIVIPAILLLITISNPVFANPNTKAMHNYSNSMCHKLVGAKNLTGAAEKAAWAKCKENPDVYK